jgi:hypothetical protein
MPIYFLLPRKKEVKKSKEEVTFSYNEVLKTNAENTVL